MYLPFLNKDDDDDDDDDDDVARGGTPIWNRRGCLSSRLGV